MSRSWTDFPQFFEQVSGSFKTCIATSMDPELLAIADARLGLSALFGGRIFTTAAVPGRGKPAPDLFLHAATDLHSEPGVCIVIEDAPSGLEAAAAAGMYAIGLASTFDAKLLHADLVIESFHELDVACLSIHPKRKAIH